MGAKLGHKVSEETKAKIRNGMKGKHNSIKTQFGNVSPWNKGKIFPQFRRANSANWKGGIETYREIVKDMGKDLSTCQICKDTTRKIVVHHHNGNRHDNSYHNLGIVCTYCHNAIHDNAHRKLNRFQKGHLPYTNKLP